MLRRGQGHWLLWGLCALAMPAADAPIVPLTVCEVTRDISAHEGKVMAVMGRFSSRRDGRTLNEESCGGKPNSIPLREDLALGPKPPKVFELDGDAVTKKLKQVQQHTTLHTFRFGSSDYDRWAVIYGRLEVEKNAGARLAYRGDGVIVFLHEN